MRLITAIAILCVTSLLAGCGGGGGSSSSSQVGTPGSGGGGGNPGGAVVNPTPVTPAAGSTVSAVDINVPSVSPPVINIQVLGAALPGAGTGFAQATGAIVHRGTAMRILVFGTGLAAGETVAISGPSDISITAIQAITSKNGLPGLSFLATIDANAALGGRTVVVRDKSDNISSFSGGLEVMP